MDSTCLLVLASIAVGRPNPTEEKYESQQAVYRTDLIKA
jgi:hypothetical protein